MFRIEEPNTLEHLGLLEHQVLERPEPPPLPEMPDQKVVMDMAREVAAEAGVPLKKYLQNLGLVNVRHLPDLWKHVVETVHAKQMAKDKAAMDTQVLIEHMIHEEDSLLSMVDQNMPGIFPLSL